MALTPCPECHIEISDKAIQCPKCGHPMDKKSNTVEKKNSPWEKRAALAILAVLVLLVVDLKFFHVVKKTVVKPPIPVQLFYRKALLADSLVIILNNTSTNPLDVLVSYVHQDSKESKMFRLVLDPNVKKQIGHLEGYSFEQGDIITVASKKYSSM